MVGFLLSLLYPFRHLFSRAGIDFGQLQAIIRIKMTVDNRTVKKIGDLKKEKVNYALLQQGFSMLIIGSYSFLVSWSRSDFTTATLFFHSMVLVMLILSLLTEYSQMLFDVRDMHILTRLPVNSRTVSTAKLICMGYYMLFLSLCAAIVPVCIFFFKEQNFVTGFLFLLATIFNALFALLLTNLIYLGCIRFSSGEKFKNILSYIQMGIIIIFVISYQLLVNIPDQFTMDLSTATLWWLPLLPPVWFTALSSFPAHPTTFFAICSTVGILLPLLSAYVTVKWFAPYFLSQLEKIEKNEHTSRRGKRNEKIACLLSSVFTRNTTQKSGFLLTWRMSSGNRKYKEAILPTIAYMGVFIAIQIYHIITSEKTILIFAYITPLYITLLISFMIIESMKYNDDQGDQFWIYRTKPLEKPGIFILGTFKAIYIKYFLPLYLLLSIIIGFLGGISLLDDLLFIFSVITLISLLFTIRMTPSFPFCQPKKAMTRGKVLFYVVLLSVFCFIFILIHIGLNYIPFGITAFLPIIWGLIWLTARGICNLSWKQIDNG